MEERVLGRLMCCIVSKTSCLFPLTFLLCRMTLKQPFLLFQLKVVISVDFTPFEGIVLVENILKLYGFCRIDFFESFLKIVILP